MNRRPSGHRTQTAFNDRLRTIEISVTSPDGTVTLDADGEGRLKVRLADGALRRHTERTLAAGVDAVIRGALQGMRRGYVQASRATFPSIRPGRALSANGVRGDRAAAEGGVAPQRPRPARDAVTGGSRIARYRELVEVMHLVASSQRGHVTVTRDAARDVTVQIGRGTLASLSEREVEAEILSALTHGLATFNRTLTDIRRQVFGDDLPFSEPEGAL